MICKYGKANQAAVLTVGDEWAPSRVNSIPDAFMPRLRLLYTIIHVHTLHTLHSTESSKGGLGYEGVEQTFVGRLCTPVGASRTIFNGCTLIALC